MFLTFTGIPISAVVAKEFLERVSSETLKPNLALILLFLTPSSNR